jgi:hypothetical protein
VYSRVSFIGGLASATVVAVLVAGMLLLARTASAQAAVELTHFEVQDREDGVLVTWGTGNELTTYGFNLHRATVNDLQQSVQLNEEMFRAKRFPDVVGADYQYLDTAVEIGTTYYYWLEALDLDGNQMHGPKWTTHGPSATATSTPSRTPTLTPTTRPSPTPTPTRTQAPTATPTPTVVPSVTPTFTATSLPAVSPTGTPTTTEAAHRSPSVTPLPASTATLPLAVPSAAASRPAATNSPSPVDEGSGLHGAADSRENGVPWPFLSMNALLLLGSVTSFLGALLALVAYLLIRRFGV